MMILGSLLDFHWYSDPSAWVALFTLSLLEIVLGIDNVVFISIIVDRLPPERQKAGRLMGLGLAMGARMLLLLSITWLMGLTKSIFTFPVHPHLWEMMPEAAEHQGIIGISWKDLILLVGGGFLIWKSTSEIHHKIEGQKEETANPKPHSFGATLVQIMLIDIIFSLDSVITAVGMVNDPKKVSLMMVAVVISIGVMMAAAGSIAKFINKHPSIKVLALSFLILIGTALVAEGLSLHIPKGYVYFSMVFSLIVELINLKVRAKSIRKPAGSH